VWAEYAASTARLSWRADPLADARGRRLWMGDGLKLTLSALTLLELIPAPSGRAHSVDTCSIEGCRRALAVVWTGTIVTTSDISYPG
jgi:hypothetical protein